MQTPAGPPSGAQGASFPFASKHMPGASVPPSAGMPLSAQALSVQAIMPPAVQLQVLQPSALGKDAPSGKGLLSYRHSTPASLPQGMTFLFASKQVAGRSVPASAQALPVVVIWPSIAQAQPLQPSLQGKFWLGL